MRSNLIFRKLRADEVEARVGTCNEKGFTLLIYKDARCDMNILDETVGAENWQRDHKEVKGNLYCGVAIWDRDKNQWIWKWDCGTESNTEKEKGESSDSFKRACFNLGIGRELYTSPFIWIEGNTKPQGEKRYVPTIKSFKVTKIGYDDDGRINELQIKGGKDIIFDYSQGYKPQNNESKCQNEETVKPKANTVVNEPTLDEALKRKTKDGRTFSELSFDELDEIIKVSNGGYYGKCAKLVKDFYDLQPIDDDDVPWA